MTRHSKPSRTTFPEETLISRTLRFMTGKSHTKRRKANSAAQTFNYGSLEPRQLMATLSPGSIHDDAIGSPGEVDTHYFYATAGSRVGLALNSQTSQAGFQAMAEVIEPGGNVVKTLYANSNSEDELVDLQANGFYKLRVRDAYQAATGSYSIGYEGINPVSLGPTGLLNGQVATGSIGRALEKDQFIFWASSGQSFELAIFQNSGVNNFHAVARLFSPSGVFLRQLWSNSNSAEVTLRDLESGFHMIQVSDDDLRQTGSYSIGLERTNPPSQNALTLTPGQVVPGTISSPLEKKQFTFYGNMHSVYEVAITSTPVQAGYLTRARLFSPGGELIENFYANSNSANRQVRLPQTGRYILEVFDDGLTEKGNFTVGLEGISPWSFDSKPLVRGGIVFGSIDSPIDKKQFRFYSPPGSKFDIAINGTPAQAGFLAKAVLYNPAGEYVEQFWAGTNSAARRLTLTQGGFYLLQVQDDDLVQKGAFSIGLESINPISPNAKPLVNGGVVSGTTDLPLDKKQFYFSGFSGQTYRIGVSSQATQAGYSAVAELFTPAGVLYKTLWTNSSAAEFEFQMPQSGYYMLQVQDDNLAQKGAFKVSLLGVSPASPNTVALAYNSVVNRTLADTFERRTFTVTRNSGQAFSLDVRATSNQSGYNPVYEVIAPTGQSYGLFNAGSIHSFSSSQFGKFLVIVSDYNFDSTGSFSIRWY